MITDIFVFFISRNKYLLIDRQIWDCPIYANIYNHYERKNNDINIVILVYFLFSVVSVRGSPHHT